MASIYPKLTQVLPCFFVLYPFDDAVQPQRLSQQQTHIGQLLVFVVGCQVMHKAAINLEFRKRQLSQLT
ncbi:Uncharacterised protein [Vibrio cholerae]|nr:Uncharacterised protein [Vibrio cholerae]CSD39153.1 Uncharacterised protein [Vibrio cholerae]CSI37195.1 Uncharacterised protein [Vibrio cholerae]